MNDVLWYWQQRSDLAMQPPAIAQELAWGEDVDGLVDLPIREILDRLKAAFPRHRETAGHLSLEFAAGRAEATWSWQHVRLELADMNEAERQRLLDVAAEFGCTAYEA
jgi:hypothetical protein